MARPTATSMIRALLVTMAAVTLAGCPGGRSVASKGEQRVAGVKVKTAKVMISKRSGKIRSFPCMECHDKVKPTLPSANSRAPMTTDGPAALRGKHKDLKFDHYEGIKDCYGCHNPTDVDYLRLMTGVTVTFDESNRLCGQCHGEKVRDWEIGAHGKHVGSWLNTRYRFNCTDCHHPHTPGFAPVKAMKGPPFPNGGIRKGDHG